VAVFKLTVVGGKALQLIGAVAETVLGAGVGFGVVFALAVVVGLLCGRVW
jgi:hypothetical protein